MKKRLTLTLEESVKLGFPGERGFKEPVTDLEHMGKVADKLSSLEDIEDELGIDLITLFKALKNGYYVKDLDGNPHFVGHSDVVGRIGLEKINGGFVMLGRGYREAWTKDYGKQWALTKKELE